MMPHAVIASSDSFHVMQPEGVEQAGKGLVWRGNRFFLCGQLDKVGFLHWPFRAIDVQRHLPKNVRLETFDGLAYVGLVPHMMTLTSPRLFSRSHSRFVQFFQTDLRTYVRGPDGEPGLWFFSVDVDRFSLAVMARLVAGLPCLWSKTLIVVERGTFAYESKRQGPRHRGSVSSGVLEVDDLCKSGQLSVLEHWLMTRRRFYGRSVQGIHKGMYVGCLDYNELPLYRATVLDFQDEWLSIAGFPQPCGPVIAHYSPGAEGGVSLTLAFSVGIPGLWRPLSESAGGWV